MDRFTESINLLSAIMLVIVLMFFFSCLLPPEFMLYNWCQCVICKWVFVVSIFVSKISPVFVAITTISNAHVYTFF